MSLSLLADVFYNDKFLNRKKSNSTTFLERAYSYYFWKSR